MNFSHCVARTYLPVFKIYLLFQRVKADVETMVKSRPREVRPRVATRLKVVVKEADAKRTVGVENGQRKGQKRKERPKGKNLRKNETNKKKVCLRSKRKRSSPRPWYRLQTKVMTKSLKLQAAARVMVTAREVSN